MLIRKKHLYFFFTFLFWAKLVLYKQIYVDGLLSRLPIKISLNRWINNRIINKYLVGTWENFWSGCTPACARINRIKKEHKTFMLSPYNMKINDIPPKAYQLLYFWRLDSTNLMKWEKPGYNGQWCGKNQRRVICPKITLFYKKFAFF